MFEVICSIKQKEDSEYFWYGLGVNNLTKKEACVNVFKYIHEDGHEIEYGKPMIVTLNNNNNSNGVVNNYGY